MFDVANATLSYRQVTRIPTTEDPITGELVFIEDSTLSTLRVSLEAQTSRPSTNTRDGKDVTTNYWTGRAIDPKILPTWYSGDMTLDITWDNGKTGKFYTVSTIKSRFGLEEIFNDPIKGVLIE